MATDSGSTWRKWDLHIHTPASICNDYGGDTPEIWEKFISSLENLPEDVKVIGINDYYFIDGYQKVMLFKSDGRLKNIEKIFPVIEFRIDTFASASQTNWQKVNLHVLFDVNESQLSSEIKKIREEFIEQLKVSGLEQHKTKALKRENIIECSSGKSLQSGFSELVPSTKAVFELLDSGAWKNKTFMMLGYKEWNNLDKEQQIKPYKKDLCRKADAFFTASPNSDFDKKTEEIKKIFKDRPLFHSMDIHKFEYFDTDKYSCLTWIKADPTFEGLIQTRYEPIERVKNQRTIPEEKKPYYVIDKVRFVDNTGKNNFSSQEIIINPNLNAFIGGKSTGKSLLLYYIARTINKEEVEKRLGGTKYNFEEDQNFNFEVEYKDGHKFSLNSPDTNLKRKIVYIPQNYLNELAEQNYQNQKTLDDFVWDILSQNEEVEKLMATHNQNANLYGQSIANSVNTLYELLNEIEILKKEMLNIGDEEGIKKYIKELEKEVQQIKTSSGLSATEIKTYEEGVINWRKLKAEYINLQHDKELMESMSQDIKHNLNTLIAVKDEFKEQIITLSVKTAYQSQLQFLKDLEGKLSISTAAILTPIIKRMEDIKIEQLKIEQTLKPITSKVKLRDELKKKGDLLKLEEEKLQKIKVVNSKQKIKKDTLAQIQKDILKTYSRLFDTYTNLQSELKKHADEIKEIELNINVWFDEETFNKTVIDECFNKNDLKRILNINYDEEYRYKFEPGNHLNTIRVIYENLLAGNLKTIKSRLTKDSILKLFENNFDINFKLSYKNDSFEKMSPGKRGIVLLKLLIELSSAECPILIDQPEDDLDTRSIYDELAVFIREKKVQRQILIASHNPNLVVGVDSEEVVVSNQDGQEIGRDNEKYKFEYISGGIENTSKDISKKGVLYKYDIRDHLCSILEGGKTAFHKREQRYAIDEED